MESSATLQTTDLTPPVSHSESSTELGRTDSTTTVKSDEVGQNTVKEIVTPKRSKRRLVPSGSLLGKVSNLVGKSSGPNIAKTADDHAISKDDQAKTALEKAETTSTKAGESSESNKEKKAIAHAKKQESKHWDEAKKAADKSVMAWQDAILGCEDVINEATIRLNGADAEREATKDKVKHDKQIAEIGKICAAAGFRIEELKTAVSVAMGRVICVDGKIASLATPAKEVEEKEEEVSDVSRNGADSDSEEESSDTASTKTGNLLPLDDLEEEEAPGDSGKAEKKDGKIETPVAAKTGCCSNWDLVGIVSLVVAAVGIVFAAFGALCLSGVFPMAFVGGLVGAATMTSVGLALTAAGFIANICHNKCHNKSKPKVPQSQKA